MSAVKGKQVFATTRLTDAERQNGWYQCDQIDDCPDRGRVVPGIPHAHRDFKTPRKSPPCTRGEVSSVPDRKRDDKYTLDLTQEETGLVAMALLERLSAVQRLIDFTPPTSIQVRLARAEIASLKRIYDMFSTAWQRQ